MPKRRHDDLDAETADASATQSHHSRYRVHVYPDNGPLYIANFATRSVVDSSNVPSHGPSLDNPQVYIDRKQQKAHGIGSSFSRSKNIEPNTSFNAMVTSNLVEGESSHGRHCKALEYSGTTNVMSAVSNHRRLYVAFVNKNSRKLSIIPGCSVFMRPTLESNDDDVEVQVPNEKLQTPDVKRQSVQDLTMHFGSHRKQRALQSANERKSLAADAINSAIETAVRETKTPTPSLNDSTGENSLGTPETPSTDEDLDIGAPHFDAVTPNDVFPLLQLISDEHLAMLQPIKLDKQSELPMLVRRCLSNTKPTDSLLRVLAYLRILIDMHKARGAKVKRGDVVPRFLPAALRDALVGRFMVIIEAKSDAVTWAMPPRLRTRLLAHILLLSMHAFSEAGNSFAVNVSDLQTDLALAPRTLISVARQFGCSINTGGQQVISIQLPYKPPPPPTLLKGRKRA